MEEKLLAILNEDCMVAFGSKRPYNSRILQNVRVPIIKKAPLLNQPENFIIDKGKIWIQSYKTKLTDLVYFLDFPNDLWGREDFIFHSDIISQNTIIQSLFLIQAKDVLLYSNNYKDKKRRRVKFLYNNITYDFACTDPNFDNFNNRYFNDAILCISLGETYREKHFKIVASIIVDDNKIL